MVSTGKSKVVAIIPAHNQIAYTLECIASLKSSSHLLHRIVVIDDGSTDGTSEIVAQRYPDVIVMKGDGNLWWSGAVNVGIDRAMLEEPDYLLLINQDNVIAGDALACLVECANGNRDTIIGSIVVEINNPNHVIFCGGALEWLFRTYRVFIWETDKYPKKIDSDIINGMGTLIPSEVVRSIGKMDEKYFPQYFGDTDYGLRAINGGYRLLIEPRSKVFNREASTGQEKIRERWGILTKTKLLFDIHSAYDIRTTYRFYRRHCPHRTFPLRMGLFYASWVFYSLAGKTPLMNTLRSHVLKSN